MTTLLNSSYPVTAKLAIWTPAVWLAGSVVKSMWCSVAGSILNVAESTASTAGESVSAEK